MAMDLEKRDHLRRQKILGIFRASLVNESLGNGKLSYIKCKRISHVTSNDRVLDVIFSKIMLLSVVGEQGYTKDSI
jgi:hypothetical protein